MKDGAPEEGDTIAWNKNKFPRTRCWGLVDWIDDKGCHVVVAGTRRNYQTHAVIGLERIIEVWQGREMFDKRSL